MDNSSSSEAATPAPATPLQAIIGIVILIPVIAFYYILGMKVGVQALFMGFLFATYWGALRGLALPDFLPTIFGGLTGIFLAYLFFALPTAMGLPGLLAALGATIIALYFMMRQQALLLLNPSFLVFLTVATIPGLGKSHLDFGNMAIGMLFGAAYTRVMVFLMAKVTAMRQPAPVTPAASQA